MKDIYINIIIILTLCISLFSRPFLSLLVYYWLSFAVPYRLGWSNSGARYILMCFLIFIGKVFSTKEKNSHIYINSTIILIILFAFWCTLSYLNSDYKSIAETDWNLTMKSIIVFCFIPSFFYQKEKIIMLLWMSFIAFGLYYGFEGVLSIITGGAVRETGPEYTPFSGTNGSARAIAFNIPIIAFLYKYSAHKYMKMFLGLYFVFFIFALIGTNSRAGILAFIITCGYSICFSQKKFKIFFITTMVTLILAGTLMFLIPERLKSFTDRLTTVQEYETDGSYLGRLEIWKFSLDYVRNKPIFGGGFKITEIEGGRAPHNVFIEVLVEQGYIGFALYFVILILAFYHAYQLRNIKTEALEDTEWIKDLSLVIQFILLIHIIGGMFINFTYNPFYFFTLGILYGTKNYIRINSTLAINHKEKQACQP